MAEAPERPDSVLDQIIQDGDSDSDMDVDGESNVEPTGEPHKVKRAKIKTHRLESLALPRLQVYLFMKKISKFFQQIFLYIFLKQSLSRISKMKLL